MNSDAMQSIRNEIDAARERLRQARRRNNQIECARISGYIAGLQVALKAVNDAAKVMELVY